MRQLIAVALFCAGLFCIAQAQVTQTGAGLGAPSSGGGGCSQATTLLARMDGGENTTAVTNLICGLVTDGTWSSMDLFYVMAINSAANAKLNWVSTSFSLGTGTPTFTANQGYHGFQPFHTGYTPSTNATNCIQNSCSIGVYDRSSPGDGNKQLGVSATNIMELALSFSGTSLFALINDNAFASSANSSNQGQWSASRTSSSQIVVYKNSSATPFATLSSTSSGLPTGEFYVGDVDGNSAPTADELAVVWVAGGMNASNSAGVQSRVNTYMTALGTNVY